MIILATGGFAAAVAASGGVGAGLAALIGVAGLVVGLGIGIAVRLPAARSRSGRRQLPARAATRTPSGEARAAAPAPATRAMTGATAPDVPAAPLQADYDALALHCTSQVDRQSSAVLRDELAALLDAAGYQLLDPVGARFDAAQHVAVGKVPATAPEGHLLITETVGRGCRRADDGQLLRPAQVVVSRYTAEAR